MLCARGHVWRSGLRGGRGAAKRDETGRAAVSAGRATVPRARNVCGEKGWRAGNRMPTLCIRACGKDCGEWERMISANRPRCMRGTTHGRKAITARAAAALGAEPPRKAITVRAAAALGAETPRETRRAETKQIKWFGGQHRHGRNEMHAWRDRSMREEWLCMRNQTRGVDEAAIKSAGREGGGEF